MLLLSALIVRRHPQRDPKPGQQPVAAANAIPLPGPKALVAQPVRTYGDGVRFDVLGPVAAHDGDQEIPLGGPRQRAVLALLLMARGRSVPAEVLLEEIWGDAAEDGRASLHTYVSNLRHLLGADRIERGAFGYRIVLRPDDVVDVVATEAAIETARAPLNAPADVARLLGDALRDWTGRPYAGLEDIPSVGVEIARLEELRASAEMDRIEAMLSAGLPAPVAAATATRDARPLDERAWSLLAWSLYRAGRQADALRTVRELRRTLRDELGLDPSPEVIRLEERILLHDPSLTGTPPGYDPPHYESAFVGRSDDLARLAEATERHRAVTIVGPGGVGKTRLAVELTARVRPRHPAGAAVVDLASVQDGNDVPRAVAAALRAAGSDRDARSAIDRVLADGVLLVLDNAERVADATGALVHDVLQRVRTAHVVVTSRRPLGCADEYVVRIEGLPVGDEAGAGDAEQLFAARCRERGIAVEPTDPGVRRVCSQLDGIPLALELAASRIVSSTPAEIADLLDRRFALLVDAGQARELHRSLEATVGWSFSMLEPDDRDAFASLGVFDGAFSVDAASAVTGSTPQSTLQVLHRLSTASLLTSRAVGVGATRYRLLETLEAYARDRLVEAGRWDEAVDRHDRHYRTRAQQLADEFLGRGRVDATDAVVSEYPGFVAAFDRLVERNPVSALPLGWVLGNTWLFEGMLTEGERRLTRLLAETEGVRSVERGDVLLIASWVLAFRNRTVEARALADEGLAVYRELAAPERVAYGCARAGHWAFVLGDNEQGLALLTESLATCEAAGFNDGMAWPIALIAQARRWSGDASPEVRTMLLDARRRFAELGETYGQIHADMVLTAFDEFGLEERSGFATEMVELSDRPGGENLMRPIALHNLAYVVMESGESERASGLNRAAIRSAMATGAAMDLGLALLQAATFAGGLGDHRRAATLVGAGIAHFGMELAPFQIAKLDRVVRAATATLGRAEVEELRRIGGAMSTEEAARYATG